MSPKQFPSRQWFRCLLLAGERVGTDDRVMEWNERGGASRTVSNDGN